MVSFLVTWFGACGTRVVSLSTVWWNYSLGEGLLKPHELGWEDGNYAETSRRWLLRTVPNHADFKTKKASYSSLHSKCKNNWQEEPNSIQKTIPKLRVLFYLKMCDYRLQISGRQGAIQPSYNHTSLDKYFRWIFNLIVMITLHTTFSEWVVYSTI